MYLDFCNRICPDFICSNVVDPIGFTSFLMGFIAFIASIFATIYFGQKSINLTIEIDRRQFLVEMKTFNISLRKLFFNLEKFTTIDISNDFAIITNFIQVEDERMTLYLSQEEKNKIIDMVKNIEQLVTLLNAYKDVYLRNGRHRSPLEFYKEYKFYEEFAKLNPSSPLTTDFNNFKEEIKSVSFEKLGDGSDENPFVEDGAKFKDSIKHFNEDFYRICHELRNFLYKR
jgi:hypothetical protein